MDLLNKTGAVNCFAVVRSVDISKVKTALCDLVLFAHLTFTSSPKKLEPEIADGILVNVMKNSLKKCCGSAAIVPLNEQAAFVISRIRKIHPPAHVIIVSPAHEVFQDLVNSIDMFPELEPIPPNIDSWSFTHLIMSRNLHQLRLKR